MCALYPCRGPWGPEDDVGSPELQFQEVLGHQDRDQLVCKSTGLLMMIRLSSSYIFFSFSRKLHSCFHSGCPAHIPTVARGSPHLHQHLLPVVFLMIGILMGIRQNSKAVLVCTSPTTYDVENFRVYQPFVVLKDFFLNLQVCACMSVCGVCRSFLKPKEGIRSSRMELQVVMKYHVDAGNRTQGL